MSNIKWSSVAQLLLLSVLATISVVSAGVGDGGSRCADASCTPAPGGMSCEPRYERDDGCCPVWYCPNGQTAYGVSRGGSFSTGNGGGFSYSSSSSSGDPAAAAQVSGMLSGLLGNLFG